MPPSELRQQEDLLHGETLQLMYPGKNQGFLLPKGNKEKKEIKRA